MSVFASTSARLGILVVLASLCTGCGQPAHEPSVSFPTAPLTDPNTATEAELRAVPGLNDEAITAILAGRPFATPTALHAAIADTLSEDDLHSVYRRLFIRVGLNTGAEDDFKLIPSTLPPGKLAHEFEEYRPYASIDEFRREMAKYVSDEEVAYLSRYVTLD